MLVWTNDIHLNFLKQPKAIYKFAKCLMASNPEAQGLVITGDISTGKVLENHLHELAEGWSKPIFIVLGNHDYYYSSWDFIDNKMSNLTKEIPNLYWLNQGFHEFDNHVLCGVGGWYDAYYGDPNSTIDLNDFYLINDLVPISGSRHLLLEKLRKRAGYEADILSAQLKKACKTDNEIIIIATHIPPYAESTWYNGVPSSFKRLPWFSSASTGALLDRFALNYPEKKFIVLTGHSHGSGIYQRKSNMTIFTGPATYGFPDISGLIDIKERKIMAYNMYNEKIEQKY